MHSVKRWRHYCDLCRRGSFYKKTMEKHERGCTLNPDRICGICGYVGSKQVPMKTLRETLVLKGYQSLRHIAGNCPACILAAIRLETAGIPMEERWVLPAHHWRSQADDFKYKDEMKEVWDSVAQDNQEW